MARIFAPIVPPTDPRQCAPWLNRELRRISGALQQQGRGLSAVARGESPDASGDLIFDLTKYFYKPGLPGGQTEFGDVRPSGTLTMSSTASPTKGKIYFGSAQATVYDEVNERIGVFQNTPTAKLHVKVGASANQAARPLTVSEGAGDWGHIGAAGYPTILKDSDDGTFARFTGNLGVSNLTVDFDNVSTITDPGVGHRTGFQIVFRTTCQGANIPSGTNVRMTVVLSNVGFAAIASYNIGGPANTAVPNNGDLVGAGLQSFSITIPDGDIAQLNYGLQWRIQMSYSGQALNSGDKWDFTEVSISVPPVGGAGSGDTLQKWEDPTSNNALTYLSDGASAEDLALTGNVPLRINSGDATTGLRMLASSSSARVEAGTSSQTNMNLVLSGTRASQGTLLTSDFVTTYLTGVVRIAGGSPANLKILAATDGSGNALWKTAAELGLMTSSAPTYTYVAVTGTYSILTTDVIVDCTANTFTVTLPTAVGVTGRLYTIKNSGTGVITVATTSSQTIDGSTTAVLQVQNVSITVVSDGANWKVI
jgi:hypothetical protein